ncbi:MAG: class I tRNA ligase family protein, partial [Treponema sp.]|nr:class I tRNA ligase family protein [Treponema sp.]
REYGADSVRMYEMFMGPLEVSKPWNTKGLVGVSRFLEKVWALSEKPLAHIEINGKLEDKKLVSLRKTFAQTVKKVGDDTSSLNFNTAISQMMIFVNELSKQESIPKAMWSDFVKVISPYAPHLGEELWEKLGNKNTIAYESWPTINEDFLKDDAKTIVVMVNGKLRGKFQAAPGADDNTLIEAAKTAEGVEKFLEGKTIVKSVVVKDKLVNFVVK